MNLSRADRTEVEYRARRAAHLPSKACWLKLRKQRLQELRLEKLQRDRSKQLRLV